MTIRGATAGPTTSAPWSFRAGVLRGVFSPDAENPNGEPDPAFATPVLAAALDAGALSPPPPGQVYLSKLPNAREIATEAAQRLGQESIHVALLGLHKYMIADCLGVKVSAGEFILELGSPTIEIQDASIVASYSIDRISFSAFKLRFRPDVTDLAQPCHFSGRVELGGEVDNATIELKYNPVIDVEHCTVGDPGRLHVNLTIGHVNIGPVPPGIADLENPFKDMFGDALNTCFFTAESMANVPDPVAALLKDMTMSLNDVLMAACGQVTTQATKAVGSAATAASDKAMSSTAAQAAPNPLEPPQGASAGPRAITATPMPLEPGDGAHDAFVIVPNPALKGRLGRLILAFPASAKNTEVRVEFRQAGSAALITTEYGDAALELLPGAYDVSINGIPVNNVTVQSRQDTRVRVGVLHVNSTGETRFDFLPTGGKSPVKTVYGEAALGFPAGNIDVQVSGQRESVAIEDGKITEYRDGTRGTRGTREKSTEYSPSGATCCQRRVGRVCVPVHRKRRRRRRRSGVERGHPVSRVHGRLSTDRPGGRGTGGGAGDARGVSRRAGRKDPDAHGKMDRRRCRRRRAAELRNRADGF